MGKFSTFERRENDAYMTIDRRAYPPLLGHLHGVKTFAEPCCGEGHVVRVLTFNGFRCVYQGDIAGDPMRDALQQTRHSMRYPDAIISNVPWSRPILHAMIAHFQRIAPTWLLFDADWAFDGQSAPFLRHCSHILAVGRLRWVIGTKEQGLENCAWYRFDAQHHGGTLFFNDRTSHRTTQPKRRRK